MLLIQLAILALATTLFAASGCGGSSKTDSATTATSVAATTTSGSPAPTTTVKVTPGKPLTHAKLVDAADAICARTNQKLSTLSVVDKNEFARVIPQVALYSSAESEELSKLVASAEMKRDWEKIVKYFYRYSEYTAQVARYDQANNFKASVPLIHAAETLHRELVALTLKDGFKHCSRLS
jgi:hypothetical protein